MNFEPELQKILKAFERYYTIKRENPAKPFVAEAEFHSHTEQYFLLREAKLSEIDSNEFVFFAEEEVLTLDRILELDSCAWSEGLSRVKPYYGHRNSDVSLIILADRIEESVFRQIKKIKHYKSYYLSFWGWSNYRILVYEVSTGKSASNRLGKDLRKIVSLQDK